MLAHAVLTSLCLGFVTAEAPRSHDAKSPIDPLQGSWSVESLQIEGKPVSEADCRRFHLTVIGNQWFVTLDQKSLLTCRLNLDPGKSPGAIDFTSLAGDTKGKTTKGIYRLQGDRLTMCRDLRPEQARPADFKSDLGSHLILVVWKHEEAAKEHR